MTLLEVEKALKTLKKDKSPRPDGFPVEFFLAFFDLLGAELVLLVEEARLTGSVWPSLNSTFIILIPKKYNPETFADFSPIFSLCNLIYKLIAKVAASRLKPILDRFISAQQFGFLTNRQISEPLAITHEVLHTVKTRKKSSMVLKLDLSKAFDRVNWSFLRLILLQIGMPFEGVNWIMGCLSLVNFALLINGSP